MIPVMMMDIVIMMKIMTAGIAITSKTIRIAMMTMIIIAGAIAAVITMAITTIIMDAAGNFTSDKKGLPKGRPFLDSFHGIFCTSAV